MHRTIAIGILAGATALALTLPAQAGPVTLKVTTCLARNHDYTQAFMETFLEPLNAKKADLQLTYLGGPEVTPFKEQASSLKRGLVDMIMCPAAYYGGLFGEARLAGAQTASIDEIRQNGAWDMMEEAWNKNLNAHILTWVFSEGQVFYTYFVAKPKESTKTGLDLTGVKIRSTGLYNPFLVAMGATTIVMAPGDVYAGLQRGVVDGLAWPWGSIGKYGWQRFLKYRVRPHFFGASQPLLVNLDKWKSLSKEQQALLNDRAKIFERDGAAIVVKKGNEDDLKLKQAGVEDITLTGAARDAYLKTIYDAKWAQNDTLHYTVDYQKLKALLYKPVNKPQS
ncbi:MAG: TRAP transporter substrate-binding protein DctP [Xanthobacteraceae bacterium]